MTLYDQIRSAYLASGMTIADIADASGCHENTVGRALRSRNVTVDNLVAIAMALGIQTITLPPRPNHHGLSTL